MGNSAGGNLAATLSLLVGFDTGPNAVFRQALPRDFSLRLQVLLYPSIDTGLPYRQRFQRASAEVQAESLPVWAAELMEDSYLPPHRDREDIFVRPVLAEADFLRQLHLPPALVLTAGMDCLEAEAEAYVDKLRTADVQVSVHRYPSAKHGFSHYTKGEGFRPDDVQDCWQRIGAALEKAYSST